MPYKKFVVSLTVSAALHLAIFGLLRLGFAVQGAAVPVVLTVRLAVPVKQAVPAVASAEAVSATVNTPPPRASSAELSEQPSTPGLDEPVLRPVLSQDPRYYFSGEVDVPARPIYLEPLIYPEQAFRSRVGGHLRLRVMINEFGVIDAVDIIESAPPGVFEEAALKALLASKFLPAMKAGWRVKSQKLIEVDLAPEEEPITPSKAAPSPAD